LEETNRFQIDWAPCTGTKAFRNGGPRNDWLCVQTSGEANYHDLQEQVVPWLLAPFKVRNILSEAAAVHWLALVCILDPRNSSRVAIASGHSRVGTRVNSRDKRLVSIVGVIGQAQVIPSGERQWIVNERMDLWRFNELYYIILSNYLQYLYKLSLEG